MKVKIGKRLVGEGEPTFIIAEAGVNHNGSVETAKKMIDAAKRAGADAIKFQTFSADKLVTKGVAKAEYQKKSTQAEGSQYDMIKKLELSAEDFRELFRYATEKGLIFLSTPFDEGSVDLLEELGVTAFKVDSGNLNNPPHVRYIAEKGLPMIVSTGMSTLGEIEEMLDVVYKAGNRNIILLHCVSNYPPAVEDTNLRSMLTLKQAFNLPVGYSDHTQGIAVSLAAVALGACAIEKHFTLDRKMKGPDHLASLEPDELVEMVKGIRDIEKCLGSPLKRPVEAEREVQRALRRSIVAERDIAEGETITREMLAVKRPGKGLPSKFLPVVVGRKARKSIKKDELIGWDKM